MGINFMVKSSARGIIHDHPRRPSCCDLALMAFLAQNPEVLFARLVASFWHGRQFHGVEKGKRDHRRESADGVFGAKNGIAICASYGVMSCFFPAQSSPKRL